MVFFSRSKSLSRKDSKKVNVTAESKSEPVPSIQGQVTAAQQPIGHAVATSTTSNATSRYSIPLPRRANGATYFSKNMKVNEVPVTLVHSDFKPAHSSSDSGYGSVVPSRAASERNANIDDSGSNDGSHVSTNSAEPADASAVRRSWSEKLQNRQSGSDIASVASNLPPISILEGYKINKKGLILDEEGEVIGKLVDGDIMDCVRQRVNAYGEVVDEYGTVIGAVRAVENKAVAARGRRVSRSPDGAPVIAAPTPLRYSQIQLDSPALTESAAAVKESEELASAVIEPHQITVPASIEQNEIILPTVSSDITARRSPDALDQQDANRAFTPTQYFPTQREQSFRRSSRSASERSLSDLSKPFARPAMNPVPEDIVADEDTIMPCNGSAFQYKGAIPLRDVPKQAYFQKSSTAAGKRPANLARHVSTGSIPGTPVSRPSMPQRHSSSSIRRGPNFSLDSTLSDYDAYTAEAAESEEQPRYPPYSHSRAPSIMTNYTTSSAKTRTYFTHAGRITVSDDSPVPTVPAGYDVDVAARAADAKQKEVEKQKKKKKTFSISSKVRQVVAAY